MNRRRGYGLEKQFRIEGLNYRMLISRAGDIQFDLIGGMTKKGSANRNPCKDLFWDEPNFEDVDLGIDTFKVFNVVKQILLEFVFTQQPGRFGFSASTARKIRIYRWMAERLARLLGNYNKVEYPAGVFNFYKWAQSAICDGGEGGICLLKA